MQLNAIKRAVLIRLSAQNGLGLKKSAVKVSVQMRDKSSNPWLNSNLRQDRPFQVFIRSSWSIVTTLGIPHTHYADMSKKKDKNVQ